MLLYWNLCDLVDGWGFGFFLRNDGEYWVVSYYYGFVDIVGIGCW